MIFLPFSRRGPVVVALLAGAVVALVLGLLLPSVVWAQAASAMPMRYVYLMGSDTVGTETVTASASLVRGVLEPRGQPRIAWEQAHQNGVLGALTLRVFAAGSAEDSAPLQMVVFTPKGDSMALTMSANGQSQSQTMPSKSGAIALIGNSVVHAALVSDHARRQQLASVPVFLTAGARTLDVSVSVEGNTTTLTLAGLPLRTTWSDGVPSEITVAPQNLRVVRTTGSTPMPSMASARVDYSAPADAPYVAENVTIPTPRGYTLAGTLTRPANSSGKVPALITISGSGPQDRDSRIAGVAGYMPFREIADTLGRRGIAVLRFDDRGVGESGGGGLMRDTATSEDFADDVLSVVQYLRTRHEVDGSRIALAGHSEGGLIAPIAAVKDPSIRAVVFIAGPAYSGRRVLKFQNEVAIRSAAGLADRQRDSIRATVPAALDSLARNNRWMGYFMRTDPLQFARQLRQPVLILQGDTDMQVTPEQADTLARVIRSAGNAAVTMRRFPDTNHLLLHDPSGSHLGYAALPSKQVKREVLGTLADWLVTTLKP